MERRLKRTVLLCLALASLLPTALVEAAAYEPKSLSLTVLRDGSVVLNYIVLMSQDSASIALPGFAERAERTLYITTHEGDRLPFRLTRDGVLLSGESGTLVNIVYTTFRLTTKKDDLWTLRVNSQIEWSVSFPSDTTLTGFSATPKMIQKGTPSLFVMPAGEQWVTYRLSFEEPPGGTTGFVPIPLSWPFYLGFTGIVIASYIIIFRSGFRWKWKARRVLLKYPRLKEEDKKIILLLGQKGGGAFEAELARSLGLPPTTTWRHLKRLEEQEIISIEKAGSQNLIRLRK